MSSIKTTSSYQDSESVRNFMDFFGVFKTFKCENKNQTVVGKMKKLLR